TQAWLVVGGGSATAAPVEPGAVFGSAGQAREGAGGECGVMLTRTYRQRDAAQIVAFADAVRAGTVGDGFELPADGPVVLRGTDDEPPGQTIARVSREVAGRFDALWARIRDAASAMDAAALESYARCELAVFDRRVRTCS